ncbi:MAG: glycogen/starch synthase, partial [Lautropia mirabilis]|nr:glycogen/starch synthase [Lautropia mirabilis]
MFADRTLARPHAERPDDAHPAGSAGGAAVPAVIWQQPNRAPAGNVRVLHVTAEVYPQVKTGGLGDIAAALPTALLAQGVDARLLVPGYPAIIDNLEEAGLVADLGSLMGAARVRVLHGRLKESGLTAYVLDAPWYFRREGNPYLGPDHRDWS